jgi:hypothetical protein
VNESLARVRTHMGKRKNYLVGLVPYSSRLLL